MGRIFSRHAFIAPPLRARRWAGVLFALSVLAMSSHAIAQQTLDGKGNPLVKPPKYDSYIKTVDGKYLWDTASTKPDEFDFPEMINAFPGPTADVLMQQCYGGGYAPGIESALAQYTFTSASNWNETSLNSDAGDNFTSSWNQSFPRSEGFYQHYQDATNGAAAIAGPPAFPAVTADPYGPSGALRNVARRSFENPLYASPDAPVGGKPNGAGANNARKVPSADQYAVLIAAQVLTNGANTPRFRNNIDLIYKSLIKAKVPANHIIVLYGAKGANAETVGGTPINGQATLANIENALSGGFGLYGNIKGQKSLGMPPDDMANLFVYTTGHGRSWDTNGGVGKYTKKVNGTLATSDLDITIDDMPANDFTAADGTDSNVGDIDLQISTPATNLAGVPVFLDGADVGTLASDLAPEVDLTPMIGPTDSYDLSVPLALVNSDVSAGLPLNLELDDLPDSDSYDSLVSAVSFNDYGDDWSVGISVPEPASLGVLAVCSLALSGRRSGRAG